MNIEIINQLEDNYSFVLYNNSLNSCIIDPAESNPILNFVFKNNLNIKDIFITHHHTDHTAGIKGIVKSFPEVNIHSPSAKIENTRFVLHDKDEINSCLNAFKVIKTPGHTLDHIIYYDKINGLLFSGDTLFRLGCGRVFEGTLNEMFNSLQKINELEKNTLIYCGHEYTLNNLNFLKKILPKGNFYLEIEKKIHADLRNKGKTIPFLLEDEKTYNLFMNQTSKIGTMIKEELGFSDFELFAYLRKGKDNF